MSRTTIWMFTKKWIPPFPGNPVSTLLATIVAAYCMDFPIADPVRLLVVADGTESAAEKAQTGNPDGTVLEKNYYSAAAVRREIRSPWMRETIVTLVPKSAEYNTLRWITDRLSHHKVKNRHFVRGGVEGKFTTCQAKYRLSLTGGVRCQIHITIWWFSLRWCSVSGFPSGGCQMPSPRRCGDTDFGGASCTSRSGTAWWHTRWSARSSRGWWHASGFYCEMSIIWEKSLILSFCVSCCAD